MTTATAQANPNIAFTKQTTGKLYQTNGKVCFGGETILIIRWTKRFAQIGKRAFIRSLVILFVLMMDAGIFTLVISASIQLKL